MEVVRRTELQRAYRKKIRRFVKGHKYDLIPRVRREEEGHQLRWREYRRLEFETAFCSIRFPGHSLDKFAALVSVDYEVRFMSLVYRVA